MADCKLNKRMTLRIFGKGNRSDNTIILLCNHSCFFHKVAMPRDVNSLDDTDMNKSSFLYLY